MHMNQHESEKQTTANPSHESSLGITNERRRRVLKNTAAAVAGAVALAGAVEVSHPKPVGEGLQTVEAGSVDEALAQVPGHERISKEASRELIGETSADGVYRVPESISVERDWNPLNNQPQWQPGDQPEQKS